MMRRRVQMVCSSDEDEDPPGIQPQQLQFDEEVDDIEVELQDSTLNLENVTLNSSNPSLVPNSYPSEPVQLEISDDDFIDVPDDFTTPSPPPPLPSSPPPPPSHPTQSFQSSSASTIGTRSSASSRAFESDSPVSGFLQGLGLRVRREWLDSCIAGLQSSDAGFSSLDDSMKAKLCFEQFLYSDMNYTGGGILPQDVHHMHLVDLPGPYVLQVDEIINISCPLRGRYQNASSGLKRCLKLSMTDGVQHVFGMEYRPIKDLDVFARSGMKVVICNVNVRHGLLMLVPEVFQVLGGFVEELDAARQRLVNEVNKPPRGKRTRNGVVPPLATRATHAAWPPHHANVEGSTNTSMPQSATSFPANERNVQGSTNASMPQSATSFPANERNVQGNTNTSMPQSATSFPANERNVRGNINTSMPRFATSFPANERATVSGMPTTERTTEMPAVPTHFEHAELNPSSTAASDLEEVQMADAVEQAFMLSGDRELPFTYLASLSAKLAAMTDSSSNVQGKIKCFLTGVKGFQYKGRTTFELRVYVDDGSLISEILIDHKLVQEHIGHSPQEVSAAVASSDAKQNKDMKEKLKQLQIFLVNFEGMMVVKMNGASPLPVAIEMSQGCPPAAASLLLRRLNSSSMSSNQPLHPSPSVPIYLSP